MRPVGVVLRALDLCMAALLAQFAESLSPQAQMIFHLCDARSAGLPLDLQLTLPYFQPQLLPAQSVELLAKLFGMLAKSRCFIADRYFLLPQCRLAAAKFSSFLRQPCGLC